MKTSSAVIVTCSGKGGKCFPVMIAILSWYCFRVVDVNILGTVPVVLFNIICCYRKILEIGNAVVCITEVKVKVKQFRYRPGVAQRVPGS